VNWNKSRAFSSRAIQLSQLVLQVFAPYYSALPVIIACPRLCPHALYFNTRFSFAENASSAIPVPISRSVSQSGLEQLKPSFKTSPNIYGLQCACGWFFFCYWIKVTGTSVADVISKVSLVWVLCIPIIWYSATSTLAFRLQHATGAHKVTVQCIYRHYDHVQPWRTKWI
jgi:hypothetical protein